MRGETGISPDRRTFTVRVPISIRRRGGRKLVLAPDGTNVTTAPVLRHIDNAMVKAIARAFRWREMLETGARATVSEIAAAEKINGSYVGRILRLTLLAPDLIESVLVGRQESSACLERLLRGFPLEWDIQRQLLGVRVGGSISTAGTKSTRASVRRSNAV